MKILELILRPALGGAESLAADLTDVWRSEGHQVDLVALDPPTATTDTETIQSRLGGPIPAVTSSTGQRNIQRLRGLRRHIQSEQYDVVHAHSLIPNLYLRMAILGMANRPRCVVTLHSASLVSDYQSLAVRTLERLLFPVTDVIISVSEENRSSYERLFPQFSRKLHVIENGIHFNHDVKSESTTTRPTKFIAISRLARQKDIETLLKGFDRFHQDGNQSAFLTIAGPWESREYQAEIEQIWQSLTCRDHIEFIGPTSKAQDLLAESDVYLSASRREASGYPIAVLEALGMGLPVVMTNTGQGTDLKSGVLTFHIGDPASMARALSYLNEHWEQFANMARSSAISIRDDHGIESVSMSYYTLIHRFSSSRYH